MPSFPTRQNTQPLKYKKKASNDSDVSPQYDGIGFDKYRFNYTTTTTPNGSQVEALQFIDELDDEDYQGAMALANKWKTMYPDDTKIIKNPTVKYNCHSFVWYGHPTTNQLWLNLSSAIVYMTDSSYLPKGMYSESDNYTADASGNLFYQTMMGTSYVADHSAYLFRPSKKWVKSKWGFGCLMQHEQSQCPYYVDGVTKFVLYEINPNLYNP